MQACSLRPSRDITLQIIELRISKYLFVRTWWVFPEPVTYESVILYSIIVER